MSTDKTEKNAEKNNFQKSQLVILGAIVLIGLFFVFPMLINAGNGYPKEKSATSQVAAGLAGIGAQNPALEGNLSTIKVQVQIPCGGHTSLILSEVKKLNGINSISAISWNTFQVTFDSTKTTQEQILAAGIFKSYPARIIN